MVVLIILFVFGILNMFFSFWAKSGVSKLLTLFGISLALISFAFNFDINNLFPQFYQWSLLCKMMTFFSLIIALFITWNADTDNQTFEWATVFSLFLFSLCGAVLLLGASNLLTLFLGIEILSIPLYVLCVGNKNNPLSLEAGVKYFILGSLSSAFMLFGIALVYGTFGTFQYQEFAKLEQEYMNMMPMFFHLGMLLLLVGIFFKLSIAPFHIWSPDVYEGSFSLITTYMATIVKIAASVSLFYLLDNLFAGQYNSWSQYVMLMTGVSILIGGVVGLVQNNAKRMMAYSSISHAAFIVLAILIGVLNGNYSYFVFYVIAYALASYIVFIIFYKISDVNEVFLDQLNGFGKKNPVVAACMAIAILSMAGIPLTAGFIAKFNILQYTFSIQGVVFIIALLGSALGMVYYLKLLNHIFFYPETVNTKEIKSTPLTVTVVLSALMILVFGIYPSESLEYLRLLF